MFLLIDNYDSFTYNLYALFCLQGAEVKLIKNDQYIDADEYKGIIISPGPSHPENSGTSMKYLEKYAGKKPIFGVCLGMQCIGHFMGFKVAGARSIMHGKKDDILISNPSSLIFSGIDEKCAGVRYHSLAVYSDDKYVTAKAASDGEIMGMEDRDNMLFGVQFHPESILSTEGKAMADNFMKFADEEAE